MGAASAVRGEHLLLPDVHVASRVFPRVMLMLLAASVFASLAAVVSSQGHPMGGCSPQKACGFLARYYR